ncbi:hydrolase [Talaromyces proteolyticus]|uniref:Hydrolase n=1 Tax=Talaromyces proteolyticus TaxID=1131652 RepID=A0AAD4KH15_9EURO|nr:hydrolase [Talaromyces proteolyticus]KAH8690187.1 hydrolase [Talaromyces proteolyticus]
MNSALKVYQSGFSLSALNTAKTASKSANTRLHQTVTLHDGRILGFAEYGSPNGLPLLFFHGFPSSRLEGLGVLSGNMIQRHGLRIIAPDRPGFGLSTPQPQRRIMDWPADVRALTSHLGLSRFAVLGGSGGGPYAVACAYSLPPEMLSAVGVLAGAGPWEAGTQDVQIYRRVASWAAKNCPSVLTTGSDMLLWILRHAVETGTVARRIDNWLESVDKSENTAAENMHNPASIKERREELLQILFEGFSQGSAAFVEEARLLTNEWGFRFEDVSYDKIQIWHGTRDANSPVTMMRYMAGRLPHCVLREYDDDHYTLVRHLNEILEEIGEEMRK